MDNALDPKEVITNDGVLEENKPTETSGQEEITEEVTANDVTLEENNPIEVSEKEEPANIEQAEEKHDKLSKEQIIDRLVIVVEEPVTESIRNEVDSLKQAFYKLKKAEIDIAKQAFIAAGGEEQDFQPEVEEIEEKLKALLQVFKEKRASITAEEEKQKETNLAAKLTIIERLKVLIESQDDFYKVYNEFKKLQQEWKEIKQVPQAKINELWKEYQHYSEKFYDLLKINNEMRDYDFKKNLELKEALCEAVERLEKEPDVISAFHQLQKLHQEWREIGPVAKEFRDSIWERFKKASTVINKLHQEHFESLKELEERNLEEKTKICEEIEAIDYDVLKGFKEWDDKNKKVLELQEKWKTIGFAPKKNNVKIFERFRAACDNFFQRKSDFYKVVKESMDENLKKKEALCEKAEALKDSKEWKEVSDKLVALQKEWKTIGAVSRKYSDAVWKRFITACDHFFEQKNIHFSSQKTEEVENLNKKKEIIEKINAIDEALPATEAIAIIRELMTEWNNVGFVPFKEKDKIYKEYRTAVDKHFDRLKIDESERRLQSFKTNLTDLKSGSDKSKGKLLSEREKLMRTYERLKNDIQTYENNIGFLSISSKGGGGLVKEMNRKIESLKEELKLIEKKVQVIDESLDA
ncbi:MAG: DUF349 domain-containing protein [Dysgonamonadaceae bacterium]|jgi:hypothetical protein|nr:DUF349 domain-containing protein [Dysgonamonadaceae bacterium]